MPRGARLISPGYRIACINGSGFAWIALLERPWEATDDIVCVECERGELFVSVLQILIVALDYRAWYSSGSIDLCHREIAKSLLLKWPRYNSLCL